MPIQNVGTLLENMVVTESAALLLDRIGADQRLGFATAFAMPALSEWCPHRQSVGISSEALSQIAESGGGSEFLNVMSRCLRYRSDRGPNGALLVSLVATLRRADLNLWANDIVDGHYGNAIPSLVGIAEVVREILPESSPSINVNVCDAPFPSSLDNLRTTLDGWGPNVGALMGFVDPMRYVRDSRLGPYTHSTDHRRWLAILNNWGPSLAVHFTGNSDSASLLAELDALREDLKQSGFPFWLEIRRQHYVVSVGSPGIEALDALERRATASWAAWCERVPEIKSRDLDISRSQNSNARAR
jgi:hypothetical protein